MRVTVLGLIASSLIVSLPALAQEPPPPEAPPPAAAPPPPPPAAAMVAPAMASGRFGGAGQLVLSVDLPFTNSAPQFAVLHETETMDGPSETVFVIQPSLDYFVIPNLTIGGTLGLTYIKESLMGTDVNVTQVSVIARVGYNLSLSDVVSIWARAGFGYVHASSDSGGSSATVSSTVVIVEAPVLFHPAPHFFLGAGPTFETELSSSLSSGGASMDQPKTTAFGLTAMIGGYFGGM
jgi:Outer membrane protein beta-barrel domain